MYKYIIEPYDADGIATCNRCKLAFFAHDLRDIYIGDLNHFLATYCRDCADKLIKDSVSNPNHPVSKPNHPVSKPNTPTYNDIIHSLSNALKLADDEPIEADALAILESSIQDIIDELQSQSPSQTPTP